MPNFSNTELTDARQFVANFRQWSDDPSTGTTDRTRGFNIDQQMFDNLKQLFENPQPGQVGVRLTFGYTNGRLGRDDSLNHDDVRVMAIPIDGNGNAITTGAAFLTSTPRQGYELPCPRYCDQTNGL
jgi:hypothetical protein